MKKFVSFFIYGGLLALTYYILPLAIIDTGSAMFILLGALPIMTAFTSFCYGLTKHHSWFFPCFVIVLFIPVVFIHMNSSAFVYSFIYGGISCIGYGIAQIINHMRK